MTTNNHVDPRGPRFGAAITSVLSLIAFYLSLSNQSLAYAIVVALGVLFIWSLVSPSTHPYGWSFARFIRPNLAAPKELEDQIFMGLKVTIQTPQPRDIPLAVIISHCLLLRRRLQEIVTHSNRLGKRQGGVRMMQPIQVSAILRVRGLQTKIITLITIHQILTNTGGLGHFSVTVYEVRYRPKAIDLQVFPLKHARRKRQYFHLILQRHLLQCPQRT